MDDKKGRPSSNSQPPSVFELFWRAAGDTPIERTPHAVVKQALLAITAFEEDAVPNPKTGKPMTLMELLADMGIEADLVYASPELARGESFDERSLVFTIGVLIFERLTERHPFGSVEGTEKVARIRRYEMGSGVNFFPSVPKELRTILMRCMGPFPEDRYRSLQGLKQDLARFIEQPHLAISRRKLESGPAPRSLKFFDTPTVVTSRSDLHTNSALHLNDDEAEWAREPARGEQSATEATSQPVSVSAAALLEPAPPSVVAVQTTATPAPATPRVVVAVDPEDFPTQKMVELSRSGSQFPPVDSEELMVRITDVTQASPGAIAAPAAARAAPGSPAKRSFRDDETLKEQPLALTLPPLPASPQHQRHLGALGIWAPVVYGLLGAGIASLVFLVISLGRSGTRTIQPHSVSESAGITSSTTAPQRASVTPPPAPVVTTALRTDTRVPPQQDPSPQVESNVDAQPESSEEEHEPIAKPEPARRRGGEPPEISAGRLVADAIRPCKAVGIGTRSLRVGAIVRADGKVVRGLSNLQQGITKKQLNCLRKLMTGMQLPLGWTAGGYIEWSIRIFPDHTDVSVVAPPELKDKVHPR